MILKNVSVFIFNLIFGIKFFAVQGDCNGRHFFEPWVDVVSVPQVTPTYINLSISNFLPMTNTFNRFGSVMTNGSDDLLIHTGKSLLVQAAPDQGTYTMGGVLGLDEYKYAGMFFLWNLNLTRAGTLLDGVGTALEVTVILANIKYDLADAANHRDGFFFDVIRTNVVEGAQDNPQYDSFVEKLSQVSVPGSTAPINHDDLSWFNQHSQVHFQELCYPGQYKNYTSNVVTNSVTACLRHDDFIPTISKTQFLNSFGVLRNQANKTYSKVEPLRMASPKTPFGTFGPVVIGRYDASS